MFARGQYQKNWLQYIHYRNKYFCWVWLKIHCISEYRLYRACSQRSALCGMGADDGNLVCEAMSYG